MKLLCLISILRNAIIAEKKIILIPASKSTISFLKILKSENCICNFKIKSDKKIIVFFSAFKNKSRILSFQKFGKPSKFIYFSFQDLWKLEKIMSTLILSTTFGIITHTSALKLKCGGKVLSVLF